LEMKVEEGVDKDLTPPFLNSPFFSLLHRKKEEVGPAFFFFQVIFFLFSFPRRRG